MAIRPDAAIEITAFAWVPEFAQGVVRDLRVRWALEEAELDYRADLLGPQRPEAYLKEQPFDQVPVSIGAFASKTMRAVASIVPSVAEVPAVGTTASEAAAVEPPTS